MHRAVMMLAVATSLSGCADRTQPTTMDLLRKGDASVCVAQDVEETLRRLILPEGDASLAQRYSISFDSTTMKRFDQPIAKMTCSTSLRIVGPMRPVIEDEVIDYVITPSARDAATFVLSGPTTALRRAIENEMGMVAASEADAREQQAASERMTALVKPGWLIGRWVRDEAGSAACLNGPYATFGRGGKFESSDETGRWTLEGQTLAFTTPSQSLRFTITEADVNRFVIQDAEGGSAANRRCTAADRKEALAALPTTEGMDDMSNLEREADNLPDLSREP